MGAGYLIFVIAAMDTANGDMFAIVPGLLG
jgi:hypothetical protein